MSMPASAQTPKPLGLPIALPPGPSTWLVGQPYGNTTGAYNFGDEWYSAGQGLHFGIDISMPCGTPLVAMADGEVMFVDNLSFGSGPHNLLIRHNDSGLIALYGHLLQRPALNPGQLVTRGQEVAQSGDPDSTCVSRPHLHLEIRSLNYNTTYNPIAYIEAPWNSLATIGSFSSASFEQDLDNPRQWMRLDDQPDVVFGGRRLNAYIAAWPPENGQQPPDNPPVAVETTPLLENSTWTARTISYEGCCVNPWWHPTNSDTLYVIDGSPGQRAAVIEWSIASSGPVNVVGQAPPPYLSPDGSHQVNVTGAVTTITRLSDNVAWDVPTSGVWPAISTDNSRLLWITRSGESVPGQPPPPVTIWVSDIDGTNGRFIVSQPGGGATWLDEARVLVTTPVTAERATTLSIVDTRDDSQTLLGTWQGLRGLSIAPGGGRLLFYRTFNDDPALDGIYTLDTQAEAQPQKLPWFGGWRWRDADSVYYLPLDATTNVQTLAYYNFATGEDRRLTDPANFPLTIANGDWSVSPDGRRIVYLNAADLTMWLLEETA
ncbi:MAG: M23 family metallopeptidase [Burkholderiales bacterium]|nr:M23 family metallopeptidase [Anaerolineae bacterium]